MKKASLLRFASLLFAGLLISRTPFAGNPAFAQASAGSSAAPAKAAPAFVAGSSQETGAATKPESASTSSDTKATSPTLLLQQQIAKLPPLVDTGMDAAVLSKQILTHLNAMLHFYRAAVQPLQKVGEPSDALYQEQSAAEATQIAQLAFRAATSQAALLGKVAGTHGQPAEPTPASASGDAATQGTDAQRVAALRAKVTQQTADLQARDDALDQQIAKAKAKDLPALRQQREQVDGGLELRKALSTALSRLGTGADTGTQKGLVGDIDRLQRSAPELLNTTQKPIALPVLETLASAHESGVASQATVLFQLLSTRRDIDSQIASVDQLRKQATDLRAPLIAVLRSTVQQGQEMSQQAVDLSSTPTTDAQDLASTRQNFARLTTTFQVLSGVALPYAQELAALESTRGTLSTWRSAVDAEYTSVLRGLLLRVITIAIVLGLLALVSQLWSRATVRYVHDLRRRRQLLVVRRVVVGFLSGLVLIFGFVTQFSSLATFAGFITAGIAVGLQSILLSVAAYFFIVGRYGVRVGDRITVAGVTGDVVEVGLVRFYMMELAGTGTGMHSTGRVAVFANSILFQTGTPLYKQMPGTEYAWHELTAKLRPGADAKAATATVMSLIGEIYGAYSARVDRQHQQVEDWMGTAIDSPTVTSRLQLTDTGLQLAVLFPVEISNAAETDQQIAERLLGELGKEGLLRDAVEGTPVIKAAIK